MTEEFDQSNWDAVMADTSKWSVMHSRHRDMFDIIAEMFPDDPIVKALGWARRDPDGFFVHGMARINAGLSPFTEDPWATDGFTTEGDC